MTARWTARLVIAMAILGSTLVVGSMDGGGDSSGARVVSAAGFEVYFNDEDESPGSVYRYTPGTGVVDTVYTRPSGRLGSFSTYYMPHKLYFVSGSGEEIYRVDNVNGQWQSEQVVFTHQTYVRDLAFLQDSGGSPLLYFSQSSGGGGDGYIFKLDTGKAVQVYRVRLNQVGGYWAGDFAFDAIGRLYLSTGNRSPSFLYRVDSGTPVQIYAPPSGSFAGFFGLPDVAYYANADETIYRVDVVGGSRSIVHDSTVHGYITDVQTMGVEPPTAVPTSTATPTRTRTPTRTNTPTRTHTPPPTLTATATSTTVPTDTATPTHTTVPSVTASATHTRVPSGTPTELITPSPTHTTVASPVASATPTVANRGTLTGMVRLDGRSDHSSVMLVVDGSTSAWSTDAGGRYSLGPLPPGQHDLDMRFAGHLRAGARSFTVLAGQTIVVPNVTLRGGDTNGDDRIDIVDGAIVAGTFGLGAVDDGFDPRGDVNGDEQADIYDLVMVGNNFGCATGDTIDRCRAWSD